MRTHKEERNPWLEAPKWHKNFLAFGDRLNFLSAEAQHANTGRLRILPARNPRKDRDGGS